MDIEDNCGTTLLAASLYFDLSLSMFPLTNLQVERH